MRILKLTSLFGPVIMLCMTDYKHECNGVVGGRHHAAYETRILSSLKGDSK